jgi:hypoxanthine phosphoribosyltransferase
VEIEFVGFALPDDAFVVGYGLDHGERWRHLPYVGALRKA